MTASNQMYLKIVYMLQKTDKEVRVVSIANTLSVSKASVCNALKHLEKKGYILHERYGDVRLTALGEKTGKELLNNCQCFALCKERAAVR